MYMKRHVVDPFLFAKIARTFPNVIVVDKAVVPIMIFLSSINPNFCDIWLVGFVFVQVQKYLKTIA